MKEYVYLELFIILNVKDSIKGTRVLNLIQEKLSLDVFVEELYYSGPNEFTALCFVKLNSQNPKILITETIILLSKLGDKWIVKCPNLDHEEYWKFKGVRKRIPNSFTVNGIKSIDFELTDYRRDRDKIEFILKNSI